MEKMRDKTFSVCSFRGVEVKMYSMHALGGSNVLSGGMPLGKKLISLEHQNKLF